ncbi:toxin-antitoxin system YwqK family antitoxin [Aquimarina agarilytica]|uniref:toxin-antitoxin system YwqK family antitoxin n=1 Tax=Aquimarina agarilytica TaxID=1087449 RepID=UPI0002895A35|nr:hypothetical protein [Aquimarina agarilytica]
MKNIIVFIALMATSFVFAQSKKPTYEIKGDLIQGTFYHENGEIQQRGLYNKEGKLHGEWKSFNDKGEKVAVGNYENGKKAGKWFFWDGNTLSEVDYTNNNIASIKTHENNSNVAVNFINN